jgi:superoxide dismutase, Cu-Zn family
MPLARSFLPLLLAATVLALLAPQAEAAPHSLVPSVRQDAGAWDWLAAYVQARCLDAPRLIAYVNPTDGNVVKGVVTFYPNWNPVNGICGVKVEARLSGLTKGAKQGIHVHEFGDLGPNDMGMNNGSRTGAHFSPQGRKHGLPEEKGPRHEGDLGNLVVDAKGNAAYKLTVENVAIFQLPGRGLTVHADEDKGVAAQPVGNSGKRVATGVIGYEFVKPSKARR